MAFSKYSILFVSHYTDLYGANQSMLNLIDGLKQQGIIDINVVIPHEGELCNKLKDLSVSYQIIPFVLEVHKEHQSYIKKTAKKYYNLFLVRKYANRFSDKKNLIVHTNSSVTFFGAYLAHYLHVPHVWHIREFGKEDYNYEYNFGRKYFLKWVSKAATIICISKALCNHRFGDQARLPVKIIYNGVVHIGALNKKTSLKAKNKTFRFGISGHISEQKNQLEAIEAFNIIHNHFDCELLIAGTGDDNFVNELKQKIKQLGIENCVTFKGFVKDITAFNKTLDCMLMCAKNEALGRVTIEAMSEGLVVIGYDNAGTSEIIENDYNGFLYKNEAGELAEKMKHVINDYDDLSFLRINAIKTVKENFTIESCAEATAKVYHDILQAV